MNAHGDCLVAVAEEDLRDGRGRAQHGHVEIHHGWGHVHGVAIREGEQVQVEKVHHGADGVRDDQVTYHGAHENRHDGGGRDHLDGPASHIRTHSPYCRTPMVNWLRDLGLAVD